jgi:putative hydrolase of the HAD superfamily
MIELIAFDADDTLWHNETLYADTQTFFTDLMSRHLPNLTAEEIDKVLFQYEIRNLSLYGYGIKSFILSMIETAIEESKGNITPEEIHAIINEGKKMISSEVQLLPHIKEVLKTLSDSYTLMVITKGDLLDQERKLEKSGLEEYFSYLEVVSNKTDGVYKKIINYHGIDPSTFMMVGNSLKSDILPVLSLGGYAVHIPYHITWEHEIPDELPQVSERFFELENFVDLPELLTRIDRDSDL